jgi:hypothetical protein
VTRVVDVVERVVLYALLVPVGSIVAHTALVLLHARPDNPVVENLKWIAAGFIWNPLQSVFSDQTAVQTALVALAFYAVVAFAVVFAFRVVRPSKPAPAPPPSLSRRVGRVS